MIIFMDGFDHYGSDSPGRLAMLDNVYAEVGSTASAGIKPQIPPFGARTGQRALKFVATIGQRVRRALPAVRAEVFCGFTLYAPSLPDNNTRVAICQARDSDNVAIVSVNLTSTGALAVRSGAVNGTLLGATAGPVIGASSWNHVEVRVLRADASASVVQVRVNGVQVLALTGLDLGADNVAQWSVQGNGSAGGNTEYWFDDLVFSDTTGDYNTTWNGDLRVATLRPAADIDDEWRAYPRQKFGDGVFFTQANGAVTYDAAAFALGSDDFTLEGWVRFRSLPTDTNRAVIFSQWREGNDERAFQLYKGGPNLDDGATVLRISDDGEGVETAISWDGWTPRIGQWYHIAVSRDGSDLFLHIDGVRQGAGFSTASTIFMTTEPLHIGAQQSGNTTIVAASQLDGHFDEVRFTVGAARYDAANFTPPAAAFPRGAIADTLWADVELLVGFNGNLTDDSDAERAGVIRPSNGDASVEEPGDGAADYLVINSLSPRDDTFISADFTFATGIYELTVNPADTTTVTLGATTYTYRTALAGADDILIGADADATLLNLQRAIIGGAGEGTLYGTGTDANTSATAELLGDSQMRASALTQGAAGNTIDSTATAGAWFAATLGGGQDIPDPSIFSLTGLPPNATAVRGVQLYNRMSKTDADACNVQASFGVAATFETGLDRPITTQPAYYTDVFEEDPVTSAALTVSSIVNSRLRLNRTV